MDIIVEPLRPEEVDAFAETYWGSFSPAEANMVIPMIYPLGLQSDLRERLRTRVLDTLKSNPEDSFFAAKDASTGQVVGISRWAKEDAPPADPQAVDKHWEELKAKRQARPPVQGENWEMDEAFFRAIVYSEAEIMRGQPYMTLQLLAVRPEYARKGVGTALLRHGLETVDSHDLPAFVQASVQGRPLYARHGFAAINEMPSNALDYGGSSDAIHWSMLRPARSKMLDGSTG